MEKTFVARRLLRAGLRDPAVAKNELAKAAVRKALDELNRELDELEQEMRFAESRARNLPFSVLGRTAGRTASGVSRRSRCRRRNLRGTPSSRTRNAKRTAAAGW